MSLFKTKTMKDFNDKFQEWVDNEYTGIDISEKLHTVKDWLLSNLPTGGAEEVLDSLNHHCIEDEYGNDVIAYVKDNVLEWWYNNVKPK